MKSLFVLLLLAAVGVAQAQPYHHVPLFDSRVSHESRASSGEDGYRCMAIGCAEGDYERYPEYAPELEVIEEEERPFDLTGEILKRLDQEPPVRPEPRPLPQSEDEARDAFYRTVRMHADGAASIEDVEAAYGHLIPYRR